MGGNTEMSGLAGIRLGRGGWRLVSWLSSSSDSIDQVESENYQKDSSDNPCDGLDKGSRVVWYDLIHSYCPGPAAISHQERSSDPDYCLHNRHESVSKILSGPGRGPVPCSTTRTERSTRGYDRATITAHERGRAGWR